MHDAVGHPLPFSQVEAGEICHECGHNPMIVTEQLHSSLPSELVHGFLYFGNYDQSSRHEMLRMDVFNIRHIVNLVPNSTNLYKNSFRYHNIEVARPWVAASRCAPLFDLRLAPRSPGRRAGRRSTPSARLWQTSGSGRRR